MDEEEQLAAMVGLTAVQPMIQTTPAPPPAPKVEDIEMEVTSCEYAQNSNLID